MAVGMPMLEAAMGRSFCDHFIESADPWAGTYCKLPVDHNGPHSAHYSPHAPTSPAFRDEEQE